MIRIDVHGLTFTYPAAVAQQPALSSISLSIDAGDFVALIGRSGSGKSTLVSFLGGMLRPPPASLFFSGVDAASLSDLDFAILRNRYFGFVFQQFHLVPRMTVLDNILLPAVCSPVAVNMSKMKVRASDLARQVGIEDCLGKMPSQLSGGQQQRVAIARALLMEPRVIIADEPTGSLDSQNGAEILGMLEQANRAGATVIVVTHEQDVAAHCRRVVEMRDGRIAADSKPSPCGPQGAKAEGSPGLTDLGLRQKAWSVGWQSPASVLFNLRRNWIRSLLTMFGVTVGIASVLAMTTLGEYSKQSILKSYEVLGANKISFRAWPNWERRASDQVKEEFEEFTERDNLTVARLFPDLEALSPEVAVWNSSALAGGLTMESINLRGVGEAYLNITNRRVVRGTAISRRQVELASPVCVLGYEVMAQLFRRSDPIGSILFIRTNEVQFSCRVVGILEHVSLPDAKPQPDEQVFIPYTYARVALGKGWESRVFSVVGRVRPGADVERLSKGIQSYFQVKYGRSVRFVVGGDEVVIAQAKRFLGVFSMLLGSIAAVALLIAGTGLTNMMLVSVAERYREIGIRKAVGATDAWIRRLFLGESISLCLVAGLFGLGLGFAVYQTLIWLASKATDKVEFGWIVLPGALALSFAGIVAIGLLSGIVPAIRAQRLQIVEALRSE